MNVKQQKEKGKAFFSIHFIIHILQNYISMYEIYVKISLDYYAILDEPVLTIKSVNNI